LSLPALEFWVRSPRKGWKPEILSCSQFQFWLLFEGDCDPGWYYINMFLVSYGPITKMMSKLFLLQHFAHGEAWHLPVEPMKQCLFWKMLEVIVVMYSLAFYDLMKCFLFTSL